MMRRKVWRFAMTMNVIVIASFLIINSSCGGKESDTASSSDEKIVVQLGDSILLERDVYARIPEGISAEDSALLYDAIVENWLEKRLLIDVAQLNPPSIERIEKMVEEYRMQLVTNEYRRMMADANLETPGDREAEDYFNTHREEFTLKEPLIKGVYVKVPANSKYLSDIRRWITSQEADGLRQLENYGLGGAMQYDDFHDTWVSWSELVKLIPWRFEPSSDMPARGYIFDRNIGGAQYLLVVNEVMHPGEVMPYEFARKEINREVADRKRSNYDSDLLRHLYSEAVKTKKLRAGGYVPMKFRDNDPVQETKRNKK